ncbi:glycosyltransferase family 4 protein [Acidobacterium sp. S8]|uniref:glycosyltransferase family 4 protein n=1 Tax=Acidobacterium sp. S8 TaxID=1641854 RepID=UPI00131AA6CC|nr:glycosyltransferase family 4 protein [Acidobacterium sp. S8]
MALQEVALWDKSVAAICARSDIFFGLASTSLYSGLKAKQRDSRYVLDRACPHVDFQQDLVREESAALGSMFREQPAWFRERQLREYEEADAILVPSDYTARTFPSELRSKLVKAPLIGRCAIPSTIREKRNDVFTVGIVGGEPRRKGYLYLLRAWRKLALPNAKLLIRSSADFSQFPALAQLLKELPNVEIVYYVPNISDFYQRCDAFVLSSVDDGFGMALFEAMANGVPCIVTRNCGASELLTQGKDGIIVDARNDQQIADSLLRLYENEEERSYLAKNSSETARAVAGGGAVLYERAIQELLEKCGSRGIALQAMPYSA